MSTLAEKIAVMQAFERGEAVESCAGGSISGYTLAPDPCWDWHKREYRIQPKEVFVVRYLKGDTAHSLHFLEEDARTVVEDARTVVARGNSLYYKKYVPAN